jgi:hypothetical protein
MSKRNPGGLISTTGLREPSATDQSQNSGVWDLEEQYRAGANGTWANQSGQAYEIGGSLRFRAAGTTFLSRTPSVASNRKTWTWSAWVKRGNQSTNDTLFAARTNVGATYQTFVLSTVGDFRLESNSETAYPLYKTNALFRDSSAWYHIVVALDMTQATSTNRLKVYVNGILQSAADYNVPAQNTDLAVNSTETHLIGQQASGSYHDGYMSETNFIDGQSLDPSYFGYFDYNGVWQPKRYTGTYGTNGFYLPLTSGTSYSGSFPGSSSVTGNLPSGGLGAGDFTVEYWVYHNSLSDFQTHFGLQRGSTGFNIGTDASGDFVWYDSSARRIEVIGAITTGRWYHWAFVRSGSTIKGYIDGVERASFTSSINYSATSFALGGLTSSDERINGYISNFRIVRGTALYTSNFTPLRNPLSAVTNTILLTANSAAGFIDSSTSNITLTANGSARQERFSPFTSTPGSDESGNVNNFLPNNFRFDEGVNQDGMRDSPTNGSTVEDTGLGGQLTGNYATLNPIITNTVGVGTLSNGNLNFSIPNTFSAFATMSESRGKYYWEAVATSNAIGIGLKQVNVLDRYSNTIYYMGDALSPSGEKYVNGTGSAYGAIWTTGDVIGVAVDMDGGTVTFYKNNVSQGAIALSLASITEFVPSFVAGAGLTFVGYVNFGQRPFAYAAPAGFKCLNTANLPQPTIPEGKDYFDITTFTGNAASVYDIKNSGGFQPDLVWLKNRSNTQDGFMIDSVRGGTSLLRTNRTNAEGTSVNPPWLTFNPDGFSAGQGALITSANSYVFWQWKAGGAAVTNTAGSITSTVSANPTAGFSVVAYTGNGTSGATVGHGLGRSPNLIILKSRTDSTFDWRVFHSSLPAGNGLALNTNAGEYVGSSGNAGFISGVSSSSFTLTQSGANTLAAVNANSATYVAYCFSEVEGYSKFGKYTGNGSTDGAFVYTGFRPKFVLIKRTDSTGSWNIKDTVRSTFNPDGRTILAEDSSAEFSPSNTLTDNLSNGFKCRDTSAGINAAGGTYIYMAFAEHPFKTARAR